MHKMTPNQITQLCKEMYRSPLVVWLVDVITLQPPSWLSWMAWLHRRPCLPRPWPRSWSSDHHAPRPRGCTMFSQQRSGGIAVMGGERVEEGRLAIRAIRAISAISAGGKKEPHLLCNSSPVLVLEILLGGGDSLECVHHLSLGVSLLWGLPVQQESAGVRDLADTRSRT